MKDVNSSSSSYFGFVVEDSISSDSGAGTHARQNWNDASRAGWRPSNADRTSNFELFRRESEKNIAFALNSLPQTGENSSAHTPSSAASEPPMSPTNTSFKKAEWKDGSAGTSELGSNPYFLGVRRQESPLTMSPRSSVSDAKHSRLSLPAHEINNQLEALTAQRSDTLPAQTTKELTAMMGPQEVVKIIEQHSDKTLILDLRVYPQYTASRVRGALNLCIPTTLLKRPAFTVQKLADTFTTDHDKVKFSRWRTAHYIVVYDASSSLAKEAITSFHVLKKFQSEGWKGTGLVIKGGFAGFEKLAPKMVDRGAKASTAGSGEVAASSAPSSPPKLPVAGGCQMPPTKNAANPFFGNIRQNMDLLDGVGQMPIQKPVGMKEAEERRLPTWLRRAASASNEGKDVSDKFLSIEKSEQKRMQNALSGSVSYGTPGVDGHKDVQVAGIEKGSKNRYNNIFPFEHSRVRLQNVPSHGCDYVNASYVKASYSNRRYIATQAPIPQTFEDFWRVIWEQDVGVIVMLTAESEGGQVKSHPYWKTGEYGIFKVKQLAERKVSLVSKPTVTQEPQKRPTASRRLTTSNATPAVEKKFNFEPAEIKASKPPSAEEPSVTVRHFTLAHSSQPLKHPRSVTQIQYAQWPDFGAPASPSSVLSLIDLVDKFQRNASSPSTTNAPDEPCREGQKPVMVHCSAGCGRTGTFCTIDSVIDMLKRQRRERQQQSPDAMDVDSADDWIKRDDIDLVAKAVEDFRRQRLSMVQNLRQFVLCYESILQWLHNQS